MPIVFFIKALHWTLFSLAAEDAGEQEEVDASMTYMEQVGQYFSMIHYPLSSSSPEGHKARTIIYINNIIIYFI